MDDQATDRDGGRIGPRFSLRKLWISSSLAAVGMGLAASAHKLNMIALGAHDDTRPFFVFAAIIAWFGGGALTGAAVLMPLRFGASVAGAGIGLVVQFFGVMWYFRNF